MGGGGSLNGSLPGALPGYGMGAELKRSATHAAAAVL